jgi:hypothetical protein
MRSEQDSRPAPQSDKGFGGDLPDWLKALKPEDESSAPSPSVESEPQREMPVVRAAAEPAPAMPATAGQNPARPSAEASPAESLVDADDLPDWLKALAETPQPTREAEPAPAAATGEALPSWARTGDVAEDGEVAAPVEEAPPVWTARRSRAEIEQPTSATIFTELATGTSAEDAAESAPVAMPAGTGRARSLVLVLLLLIIVLAAIAVVLFVL